MKKLLIIILVLFFTSISLAQRHSHFTHRYHTSHSSSYHSKHSSSYHSYTTRHHSVKAIGGHRDSYGRIKRSSTAKERFMRQTGYPHGCPGYVVDHIIPLSKGGRDDPSNMQWQTKAEAKAKDKWERR